MVADLISHLAGCYGLYLLWTRINRNELLENAHQLTATPKVSVIVPARNEEQNIATLLTSLMQQDYPEMEVVVVNDHSTDSTAEVVGRFNVTLIDSAARPSGWNGKQWACWQGAQAASGQLFLFTDADTLHRPGSIRRAVDYLLTQDADMLSTLPFHRSMSVWERLLGPFHLMLLSVTRTSGRLKPGRAFAIGQYLLFKRSFYERMDGHRAVKDEIVEDLPLANLALSQQGNYLVYRGEPLLEVRMYHTFGDFFRGWRRNFRAGFAYGSAIQTFEMAAMYAAFAALFSATILGTFIGLGAVLAIVGRQGKLGNFSPLGSLTFLFPLATLVVITGAALWDKMFNRPVQWKDRLLAHPGQ